MSNRGINLSIIIVLFVLAFASIGVSHIASIVGVPDGIGDAIGHVSMIGVLILYIVVRQKEGKEVVGLKERNSALEEKMKDLDYYKEEYSYYREECRRLESEMASYHGKED